MACSLSETRGGVREEGDGKDEDFLDANAKGGGITSACADAQSGLPRQCRSLVDPPLWGVVWTRHARSMEERQSYQPQHLPGEHFHKKNCPNPMGIEPHFAVPLSEHTPASHVNSPLHAATPFPIQVSCNTPWASAPATNARECKVVNMVMVIPLDRGYGPSKRTSGCRCTEGLVGVSINKQGPLQQSSNFFEIRDFRNPPTPHDDDGDGAGAGHDVAWPAPGQGLG